MRFVQMCAHLYEGQSGWDAVKWWTQLHSANQFQIFSITNSLIRPKILDLCNIKFFGNYRRIYGSMHARDYFIIFLSFYLIKNVRNFIALRFLCCFCWLILLNKIYTTYNLTTIYIWPLIILKPHEFNLNIAYTYL